MTTIATTIYILMEKLYPQFTLDTTVFCLCYGSGAGRIPFESMCVFTLDADVARLRSVTAPAMQREHVGLLFLPGSQNTLCGT